MQKKKGFPRIYAVNVNKSTVNCEFGHIYRRNPQQKTSFFVQCNSEKTEKHNSNKKPSITKKKKRKS